MKNTRILTLIFVLAFLTLLVGCLPQPTNQAPIITSDPVKTAEVGVEYTYDVNATDPDEDTLTYSLITKPTGMNINSATGLIKWTPTAEGNYAVVVKVTDGVFDITQSFTIVVIGEEEPGVTPPRIYTITATAGTGGSISPSGDVKVIKGSDKTFTITPAVFYEIDLVLVDGQHLVKVPYTFTNVTENHTIHASFILIGPVYNEDKDTHHDTIQDAIDLALPDNTILVLAGPTYEGFTVDVEGLTIRAYTNPMPVIEGTVVITADNVTVDGFSIQNFSQIPSPEWSGIYLENGIGILVINNLVDGTGITFGRGILTRYGSLVEAILEDNVVRNCHLGVYVNACGPLLIRGNIIEDAAHCGIGVDSGAGVIITGNTISNCADQGIEVFRANVVANFNNIAGNPGFGVQSFGPQVDAKANWWGDASGPSGMGPGTGDAISTNVDYIPWSTNQY